MEKLTFGKFKKFLDVTKCANCGIETYWEEGNDCIRCGKGFKLTKIIKEKKYVIKR